jgi:glutathione S-transferase
MSKAEHRSPTFKKHNPMGKVPALIDGETSVWDSHAICIYLAEKYSQDDSLYPKDLLKRTQVNQILFFEASYLFQRFYEILIPLYFGINKEIPKNKIAEVNEAYSIIESFFDHGKNYLCGEEMTIADLSVWSTLLSLRKLIEIDNEKFFKVNKWLELMSERKGNEENEKGAEEHFNFIQRCIKGRPIVSKLETAPKKD